MIENIWTGGRDPDWINEEGTYWWRQNITWGDSRDLKERLEKLNISWWYVEMPDETTTHIVLKGSQIIKADTNTEAIAVFLDMCPLMYEEG